MGGFHAARRMPAAAFVVVALLGILASEATAQSAPFGPRPNPAPGAPVPNAPPGAGPPPAASPSPPTSQGAAPPRATIPPGAPPRAVPPASAPSAAPGGAVPAGAPSASPPGAAFGSVGPVGSPAPLATPASSGSASPQPAAAGAGGAPPGPPPPIYPQPSFQPHPPAPSPQPSTAAGQPATAYAPASAPRAPPASESAAGPTPQPSAAEDAGGSEAEEKGERAEDEVTCAIGEFCFGPMLTGGALNVFGLGVHARMEHWGFGFDYQFISLGYEDVDGDLSLLTFEGRLFPFGGPFYLAVGVAWQSVAFETAISGSFNGISGTVKIDGDTTIPLLKLGIGFMGRDGFVMGIDLGFGFRLSGADVRLDTDLPPAIASEPEVLEAKAQFEEAAEAWIEWLPFTVQFNVLRIGYFF